LFRLLTPSLYDDVLPYPGARQAIRSLSKEPGVELLCVTSNPEKDSEAFMKAKARWLHRYVPELSDRLVAARNKSGLGLDVLVDDAPHHHEAADCTTVLVKRPWNRGVQCAWQFTDWPKGYHILTELIADRRNQEHEHGKMGCR
jgi:5'(3')-deoxyribonucleotidase